MNFVDVLGGLGAGYNAAEAAQQKGSAGWNTLQRDNIATARLQDQYNADDDYDIFNATAANNRSKQDLGEGTNDLALMGVQDKMDQFDPATRAQIGALAQQFGGDTPEFRQALGDYQASRGRLADADPQYEKFNREVQARQQVVAQMREMPAYKGMQIDSVQKDEDGNLVALVGQPDENGDYEIIDLPPSVTKMYAALTGNTRPMNFDLKQQQALLVERAARAGHFPGTRAINPQRTLAQQDLNTRADARNQIQLSKLQQDQIIKFVQEEAKLLKSLEYAMPNQQEREAYVRAKMQTIPGYTEAFGALRSATTPAQAKVTTTDIGTQMATRAGASGRAVSALPPGAQPGASGQIRRVPQPDPMAVADAMNTGVE